MKLDFDGLRQNLIWVKIFSEPSSRCLARRRPRIGNRSFRFLTQSKNSQSKSSKDLVSEYYERVCLSREGILRHNFSLVSKNSELSFF